MAGDRTIKWTGQSGKEYGYAIYKLDETYKAVPANYVFVKEITAAQGSTPALFNPIYVGQTSDISQRFENHRKMPCIKRDGATHICVHISSEDEAVRLAEESDIIKQWNPPCND